MLFFSRGFRFCFEQLCDHVSRARCRGFRRERAHVQLHAQEHAALNASMSSSSSSCSSTTSCSSSSSSSNCRRTISIPCPRARQAAARSTSACQSRLCKRLLKNATIAAAAAEAAAKNCMLYCCEPLCCHAGLASLVEAAVGAARLPVLHRPQLEVNHTWTMLTLIHG
jgi:hypothetical protein